MNIQDKRQEIIKLIKAKKLKQSAAADALGISIRQVKRLCRATGQQNVSSVPCARRGHPAANRIPVTVKEKIIELAQDTYVGFGPTFMAEKLSERDGINVSHETLRKILIAAGIWKNKRDRKIAVHQSRERRTCFGELIQIDGSPHAWLEERGEKCCLILFIDDATSIVLYAHLEPVETTVAYFRGILSCVKEYGIPLSYYSDRHMIFRVNNAKTAEVEATQFERGCTELGIEGICANSPQAKGRVERANRTFQDRLVKEFRLAGVSDRESGNKFLLTYLPKYNKKFSVCAREPEDMHRHIIPDDEMLQYILSIQEKRSVTKNLEISFENKIYQLVNEGNGHRLQNKKVTVCQMLSGEIHVLSPKGRPLQYRVMAARTKGGAVLDDKSLNAHIDQLKQKKNGVKPSEDHPWRQYKITSTKRKLNPKALPSRMATLPTPGNSAHLKSG